MRWKINHGAECIKPTYLSTYVRFAKETQNLEEQNVT